MKALHSRGALQALGAAQSAASTVQARGAVQTKGPAGPLAPSSRRLTDDLTALGAHTTVRGGQNKARVCERAPTQQGPPATKTRHCASRSSLFATFCKGRWAGARHVTSKLSRPLRKKKGKPQHNKHTTQPSAVINTHTLPLVITPPPFFMSLHQAVGATVTAVDTCSYL
jgi:hypothetical protein